MWDIWKGGTGHIKSVEIDRMEAAGECFYYVHTIPLYAVRPPTFHRYLLLLLLLTLHLLLVREYCLIGTDRQMFFQLTQESLDVIRDKKRFPSFSSLMQQYSNVSAAVR